LTLIGFAAASRSVATRRFSFRNRRPLPNLPNLPAPYFPRFPFYRPPVKTRKNAIFSRADAKVERSFGRFNE